MAELYHRRNPGGLYDSTRTYNGMHEDLHGNSTILSGDCTNIHGDCSGLWGDCSGYFGDCTGYFGKLGDIKMKKGERYRDLLLWSIEIQPN
jgi:hypothetical protein